MARTVTQPATRAIKDDIGDLKMELSMDVNPADPENIVATDAHVRMPIHYADGGRGTSQWYKVTDIGGLSGAQKTGLRDSAKIIRDHIHADIGGTGTPDDA